MFRARTAGPASAVDQDVSRRQRRRGAGARGFATGAGLLARVVRLVVSIIVLIIVAGIVLVVLKANPGNSIVSQIHDWARSLAGPFDGIFSFHNAREVPVATARLLLEPPEHDKQGGEGDFPGSPRRP